MGHQRPEGLDHQAQFADYVFLLAAPTPMHQARRISYLLVPMKQEGIEYARSAGRRSATSTSVLHQRPLPKENVSEASTRLEGAMTPRLRAWLLSHHRPPPLLEGVQPHRRRAKPWKDTDRSFAAARPTWSNIKIMEINGYRSSLTP